MEKLKEIATVFRKEEIDYLELTKAVQAFDALAMKTAGMQLEQQENRKNMYSKTGMALGTTWAAMCIKDIIRTKKFIKGIFEAIEFVKKHKKGPVTILYAGTGPFATLLLPVLATFTPQEVQCVLLEINTKSFVLMQQVIEELKFEKHVKAFENADATTYKINPDHEIDILLSETMQRALESEQQVPIVMNLMQQLRPEVIMIPECISLELGLMDIGQFLSQRASTQEESYHKLGVFYKLTKEDIASWFAENKELKEVIHFTESVFTITNGSVSKFRELIVRTGITVFGDTKIEINESGLTTPLILEALPQKNNDFKVKIHYKVDKVPGIEYQVIEKGLML
ncbi:hypothetical protein [Ascidiimonas sp. W6]|uniref:hypothetical protein n=1 Tax=Ascidiimonas meishanensis TaxID=3128903 RepID=UPI0030EF6697